jgi:leader peptidase (prepilin peptidase)/N-methyltransferase
VSADTYWTIVAGAFGAVVGSFLNVVIYRVPRGRSVAAGRSRCPSCAAQIAWFDNVPLVSWVFLGGKCRRCRWRIPARYPLVEALSSAAAALIVHARGLTLEAAWLYAFVAIMIAITFIDWEHQIIPDTLSLGGVALGWIGAVVCLDVSLVGSLVGSIAGAALVLAIAALYKALRKADGMGGGDVKLMAMIGAFLGWKMIFPVLFVAALFGSLYGIFLMRAGSGTGKTAVAFGSFLAPAACLMLFAGDRLIALYLGVAR